VNLPFYQQALLLWTLLAVMKLLPALARSSRGQKCLIAFSRKTVSPKENRFA